MRSFLAVTALTVALFAVLVSCSAPSGSPTQALDVPKAITAVNTALSQSQSRTRAERRVSGRTAGPTLRAAVARSR